MRHFVRLFVGAMLLVVAGHARAAAPAGATGRVYGVVYSGLDIGLASGPLFFGMLMDARWPSWVFFMIGAFQMLAIFTAVTVGNGNRSRRDAGSNRAAAG